ncbi:MAG TPA: deoxyhypusine synthase family protein, partial [Candidatus Aminicenantes bacterium]|nr:deoxyhypusine synthase family protein [Candidatus Aminicenantes bacterium]
MRDHAQARLSSPAGLKTYPLRARKSKVDVRKFGRPVKPRDTIRQFLGSLPDFLAASDFRDFLRLMQTARKKGRSIHFAFGAHVIKVGLGPVLIDLMKEGWISALSTNGAGIIHDFEIAYCGLTSEEVKDELRSGRFGMARETGLLLNQ